MNQNIEQAIEAFRNQAGRYRRTNRYYHGEHNLNFATEKFVNTFGELFREFALNLCPAICDAVKDKLKIEGFGVERVQSANKSDGLRRSLDGTPNGVTLTRAIESVWRNNRMAIRAGEVHKEALKNGDAYVIVWPSANGGVSIFPNSAETCTVHYDDEMPGRVAWAAKYWRTDDKRTRLNLFFPERIEKFISADKNEAFLPDAKDFRPFVQNAVQSALFGAHSETIRDRSRTLDNTLNNPFGIVPVFHFANNADIGAYGQSELEAAIPVQDGLNKAVLDMLVAMEVSAFRQRWIAGIEIKYSPEGDPVSPFQAGIDRIWQTENPEARFGDFAAADLDQFLKVKDGFRIDMASVTGTPLYYLMPQIRGFPSGESLRKAETRFLAKVRDRQESFGVVWAEVMAFALKATGNGEVSLITNWEDPSPANEREVLENLRLKKDLGIATEQLLKEAGYGDVDVRRMTK
jgi:hypothetical protein